MYIALERMLTRLYKYYRQSKSYKDGRIISFLYMTAQL